MARPAEELEKTWELCRRLDFSPGRASLSNELLEPLACLLRAETAVFRVFSASLGVPRPTTIVSVGVRDSVHDAYWGRYFKLDPVRRLLTRRFTNPLFADLPGRGEWSDERKTTAGNERTPDTSSLGRCREEFRQYRDEFLLPNNLCHHLGFCFQDASGNQTILFNFHRGKESSPFDRLELARAKIVSVLLHAKAAQFRPVASLDDHHRRLAIDDCDALSGEAFHGAESVHYVDMPDKRLSARELEVAETVAAGLTNKEVAAALGISVRTVENHMRSIYAKLKITTRTRLAAKLHEMRSSASATLRTAS